MENKTKRLAFSFTGRAWFYICDKCEKALEIDFKFCPYCGREIEVEEGAYDEGINIRKSV